MSKSLLTVLLALSFYTSYSQYLLTGIGATYGSVIDRVGINTRVYYGLNEHICLGPEFSYFPTVMRNGESIQLNEYALIAHYIFEINENFGFYSLLGVNYNVESTSSPGNLHIQNAYGAAIGGGFHSEFKNFMPFMEYQYVTGALGQNTFTLGLIYNFEFGNKEEIE